MISLSSAQAAYRLVKEFLFTLSTIINILKTWLYPISIFVLRTSSYLNLTNSFEILNSSDHSTCFFPAIF